MPKRLPEWKFKRLVGYSKSHGGKIHWQTEDGEDCSRSECTWQPKSSVPVHDPNDAVEIDSSELQGVAISLEIAGKTHRARVYDKDGEGSGGATSTSYYLIMKYKKKANSRFFLFTSDI